MRRTLVLLLLGAVALNVRANAHSYSKIEGGYHVGQGFTSERSSSSPSSSSFSSAHGHHIAINSLTNDQAFADVRNKISAAANNGAASGYDQSSEKLGSNPVGINYWWMTKSSPFARTEGTHSGNGAFASASASGSAFAGGSASGSAFAGTLTSAQHAKPMDVSGNPFLNGAGFSAGSSSDHGSGSYNSVSHGSVGVPSGFKHSGSSNVANSNVDFTPQISPISGGSGNPFLQQTSKHQESVFGQQENDAFWGSSGNGRNDQEQNSESGSGLTLSCRGQAYVCAAKHLCSAEGYFISEDLTQVRSGPQSCNVDTEVCCMLKRSSSDQTHIGTDGSLTTITTSFGTKYDQSEQNNGGIFGNSNDNYDQIDLNAGGEGLFSDKNVGQDNAYLPPIGSQPSSNVPAFVKPPEPDRPAKNAESEPSTPNNNIRRPIPPPADTPRPHVGCAAALICVEEQFCTLEGSISPTPVVLSSEQILRRAPITDCQNPDNGIIGKCCRDPNYVDPWPTGNLPANYSGGFDEQGFPTFLNIAKTRPPKNGNKNRRPISGNSQNPTPVSSPPRTPQFPNKPNQVPNQIPSQPTKHGFSNHPNKPNRPVGFPNHPNQPDRPSVPSLPSKPSKPSFPSRPNQPNKPGVISYPGQPINNGFPNLPNQPSPAGFPELPNQPNQPGTPSIPNQPIPAGFPDLPSQQSVTGFPDFPNQPSPDSLPDLPRQPSPVGFPNLPRQPSPVGFPNLPSQPSPTGFPNLPSQPSPTGFPNRPDQPQKPEGSNIPIEQAPTGFPDLPSQPSPAGFPDFPNQPRPESLPDLPRQPSQVNFANLPNQPSPTGFPEQPNQPSPARNPDFPNQPSPASFPDLPRQPSPTGFSNQPDQPSPVGLPDYPGQQSEPGVVNPPRRPMNPSFPTLPNHPSIPNFPSVPHQPSQPSITNFPSVPDHPSQPGFPNRPTQPSQSGYPEESGQTVQPGSIDYPSVSNQYIYSGVKGAVHHKSIYAGSSTNQNPTIIQSYAPGSQCGIRHNVHRPDGLTDVDVGFGEIPWQAMILLTTEKTLLCSGAIIAPNAVVTSARCVEGHNARNIAVKTGEWKLGYELKNEEPLPFEITNVVSVVTHPQYNAGGSSHDVAILFLEHNVHLAQHVDMLCLPQNQPQLPQIGRKCISTGWGKAIIQLHAAGALMHSIDVDVLSNEQCQQRLNGAESQIDVDDSLICAKAHRTSNNMCQVDIGGPLACDRGDGNYELVGIYSQDTGCSPTNQVATFARIDTVWVQETLSLAFQGYSSVSIPRPTFTQTVENHRAEQPCDCRESHLPSENNQYLPPH